MGNEKLKPCLFCFWLRNWESDCILSCTMFFVFLFYLALGRKKITTEHMLSHVQLQFCSKFIVIQDVFKKSEDFDSLLM